MPQAVPLIIAWAAEHYVIAQLILTVAIAVYGSADQRRRAKHLAADARRDFNASLEDRTITSISAVAPWTYVYGRARVGSVIVAMFTSGVKDEFKHLVCVHAAHECDGIEAIYINGKYIGALDGNGDVLAGSPYSDANTHQNAYGQSGVGNENFSGVGPYVLAHTPITGSVRLQYTVTTGIQPYNVSTQTFVVAYTIVGNVVTPINPPGGGTVINAYYQYVDYTPRVRVTTHLGVPGQTVDTTLQAAVGAFKWPSTATLQGFTYSVVRLDLNKADFQSGIPSVEVLMRGKKIYDYRNGLTAWTQNNALCTADYLTSPICEVPLSDIPISDVITAANVCDESIGIGPNFGPRYTMNGTVTSDQDKAQVLQSMADSMAGTLVSTTWQMRAGKYVAPIWAFTDADVVGSIGVTPGVSNADLFNGVRGKYAGAETLYVVTDFKSFQNTAYVAADGDELWQDLNYPWTDRVQRIWNLTRILTEDQRNGFTMKIDFSLKAWPCKVGERMTFTSTFFGQVAKIFRITDKSYNPSGMVTLTIKEDAPSIWDLADSVVSDDTPNTNLVDPFLIDTVKNLTLTSGTNDLLLLSDGTVVSRIHATWDVVTTQSVFNGGLVEIEWYKIDSSVPQKTIVSGSATDTYLSPVEDGQVYDVRARAVNPYLNIKSDWTHAAFHQVIGKTEPPPSIFSMSIDGRVLSWDPVVANDLAGYVFKFHYGNNTDWNSATLLYEGIISENPYELKTLPSGAVTIMGKAVDTTGNESLITANIFTDLGDIAIDNQSAIYNFDPTFPGTYSGCTVSGGDLVASALDSFYGTDDQSFYGLDLDSFYEPSSYAEMVYTTDEVPLLSFIPGTEYVLNLSTQGTDVTVEYRETGTGSFYGSDADSFYGLDPDPFYDGPGAWRGWPGSVTALGTMYQFRVTIGAGATQGKIFTMSLVANSPPISENVPNLVISIAGTVIPHTKAFTAITTVQSTLQANLSGAVTVEVDKTNPIAPVIKAYNGSHTAVDGAIADITLEGY